MENVFNTEKELHNKYDLKGSLYKRETNSYVHSLIFLIIKLIQPRYTSKR